MQTMDVGHLTVRYPWPSTRVGAWNVATANAYRDAFGRSMVVNEADGSMDDVD